MVPSNDLAAAGVAPRTVCRRSGTRTDSGVGPCVTEFGILPARVA